MSSTNPSSGGRKIGNSATATSTTTAGSHSAQRCLPELAERAHPASLVSSPIRPWGRKTMISTR